MNPFIYWVSIFYHWYYDKPNRRKEAYYRALMITIFFLGINLTTLLLALNFWDGFVLNIKDSTKIESYFKVGAFFAIFYYTLSKLAPKEKVEAIDYETLARFKDSTIAIVYWVVSIIAFVLVMHFIRAPQLEQ